MKRIEEQKDVVLKLFEEHQSAQQIALSIGMDEETVRRALIRWGVATRSKRLPCRAVKDCPALICMLAKSLGWGRSQISDFTGYNKQHVGKVLGKHGLTHDNRFRKCEFDLEEIEAEFLSGATTNEIASMLGVSDSAISLWLNSRGVRVGRGSRQKDSAYQKQKRKQTERRFVERLQKEYGEKFEYVGDLSSGKNKTATIRCTDCGSIFSHHISFNGTWICPGCAKAEREKKQRQKLDDLEYAKYERMFSEIREYAIVKTCPDCGRTFQSVNPSQKYCSKQCQARYFQRKKGWRNYRQFYRKHGGEYDDSITLKELFKRDGGICQICGKKCNWDDKAYGKFGPTYPSIDHIVPKSKGGPHTWGNVQLAHFICNMRKSTKPDSIAKQEVMDVA